MDGLFHTILSVHEIGGLSGIEHSHWLACSTTDQSTSRTDISARDRLLVGHTAQTLVGLLHTTDLLTNKITMHKIDESSGMEHIYWLACSIPDLSTNRTDISARDRLLVGHTAQPLVGLLHTTDQTTNKITMHQIDESLGMEHSHC